jgi:hypothetical protein
VLVGTTLTVKVLVALNCWVFTAARLLSVTLFVTVYVPTSAGDQVT